MSAFYHLKEVKSLSVVFDEDGDPLLSVTLKENAVPSEPRGFINNFIWVSTRGTGLPLYLGAKGVERNVDASRDSMHDVVGFFESTHKQPR